MDSHGGCGDGGILQRSTTTPDGYVLNEKGQWVVDGVRHTVVYDPAHPLANVIDVWNLRLPSAKMGEIGVVDNNVQAMLTGQMEEYFAAPVGEYVDEIMPFTCCNENIKQRKEGICFIQ